MWRVRPWFFAYLAAMVDGDGSVMWCGRKPGVRAGWLAISISLSEGAASRSWMKGLRARTGGHVGLDRRRHLRTWRVTHRQAVHVALAMLPYAHIKRTRLELVVRLATLKKLRRFPAGATALDVLKQSGRERRPLHAEEFTAASIELDTLGAPTVTECARMWGYRESVTPHDRLDLLPLIAAGFFDAEGHITLCPDREYRKWSIAWSQNQSFAAWPLLAKLESFSGGNLKPEKPRGGRRWQLVLGKELAFPALCQMYPHLQIKQQQASLAIRLLGIGKVTDGRIPRKDPVVHQVAAALEVLKNQSARRRHVRRAALAQSSVVTRAEEALDAWGVPSAEEVIRLVQTGGVVTTTGVRRTRTDVAGLTATGAAVCHGGRPVPLSPTKERILRALIWYDGEVSVSELIAAAWPPDTYVTPVNLRQQIRQLRPHLAPFGLQVRNVYGYGYELRGA